MRLLTSTQAQVDQLFYLSDLLTSQLGCLAIWFQKSTLFKVLHRSFKFYNHNNTCLYMRLLPGYSPALFWSADSPPQRVHLLQCQPLCEVGGGVIDLHCCMTHSRGVLKPRNS